jgi:hypothetical protein
MNDATKKRWKIRPRFGQRCSTMSALLSTLCYGTFILPQAEGLTVLAKTKGKRVALYLHVSTPEQPTHSQRLQAVAARHGAPAHGGGVGRTG